MTDRARYTFGVFRGAEWGGGSVHFSDFTAEFGRLGGFEALLGRLKCAAAAPAVTATAAALCE